MSDELHQLLDGFPVFRTLEDALHRDPLSPAWCLLPAPLVEPLLRLIKRLPSALPEGELARAIELLIIGLDEDDFSLMGAGAQQLQRALRLLGRRRLLSTVDTLRKLQHITLQRLLLRAARQAGRRDLSHRNCGG